MNTPIERHTDTAKTIFTKTQAVIEPMKDSDRKTISDVASEVASSLGTPVDQVISFVRYYLHNVQEDNIGYVRSGKFGGFIRGAKPISKVKPTGITPEVLNQIVNELNANEETEEEIDTAVGQ